MNALRRKLLRDLWRLRSQVITIALVVASGVGGFVGSLSTLESLSQMRLDYYESSRFGHVFASARRVPRERIAGLRDIPGVSAVDASVSGSAIGVLPTVDATFTARVIGITPASTPPSAQSVGRLHLRSGQWPEASDPRGALISEAFANAHALKPGARLDLLMNGRFETVTVRGIALAPDYVFAVAHSAFGDDRRFGVVWLPQPLVAAAYDMEGAFNQVELLLAPGASEPAVIAAVDRLLNAYGGAGAYGRREHPSDRALSQEIAQQRVFGTVLPAVFLTVAVFLLNVLLSRHIATERPQIAALKALGYEERSIAGHYLLLALVICTLGIALGFGVGVLFGRWMTALYTEAFHFPNEAWRVSPLLLLSCAVLVLGAAVAATTGAVRRVVQLRAAEALRPPSPAVYRRLFIEWAGFRHRVGQGPRMVMRELERRPGRSLLTTAGIASAVAIFIGGTWWSDGFENLIDLELQSRERSDVLLTLTNPAAPAVMLQAARLPGVLRVEGSREVPVQLANGSHTYRTTLSGVAPGAQLFRLLDRNRRPLVAGSLPSQSVVLTNRLLQRLDLRVGERVWVSPLVGERRARLLTVAQASDDLLALRAYAPRAEVAALTGDGDSVNLLRMHVDRAQIESFMRAAREAPAVASVADRLLLIRHLRTTTERNMLMFTSILSVFAACIAIGVVYNSARIALSERAWELATLRVLGFTRGEVSRVLLGQVGTTLLLALPLGCILGYWLAALLVRMTRGDTFDLPLMVSSRTYALAVLLTLAAGVLSALVVRRQIDRLDLIGVLKTRE